jgi:hypothetical protein
LCGQWREGKQAAKKGEGQDNAGEFFHG